MIYFDINTKREVKRKYSKELKDRLTYEIIKNVQYRCCCDVLQMGQ